MRWDVEEIEIERCLKSLSLRKFFFHLFIYFTLQYCIGFAIHWHESTMGVHVFPIMNPPPTSVPIPSLWVIPVHQPWAPVSCIEPGLAIHFTCDNLHVSMPFSHIILPSPAPTESKRLFNTSVSLLLSCIQGYRYLLSKFHIYALVYWCFSFCLTSLCIIGSSFIYLIRTDSNVFFLVAE